VSSKFYINLLKKIGLQKLEKLLKGVSQNLDFFFQLMIDVVVVVGCGGGVGVSLSF